VPIDQPLEVVLGRGEVGGEEGFVSHFVEGGEVEEVGVGGSNSVAMVVDSSGGTGCAFLFGGEGEDGVKGEDGEGSDEGLRVKFRRIACV